MIHQNDMKSVYLQANIHQHYQGYINLQEKQVEGFKKLEKKLIFFLKTLTIYEKCVRIKITKILEVVLDGT